MKKFDVVVVGAGVSGSWAAKELTEQGLKVLLLDRGSKIIHKDSYITEDKPSIDFKFRGKLPPALLNTVYPIQKNSYALSDFTRHFFIKDKSWEYNSTSPFSWIRSQKAGGKSLLWGRQTYRMSELDFKNWPISYEDLKPWYDKVEIFIGVSGKNEGLEIVPDGIFQPPFPLNSIERHVKSKLKQNFSDIHLTNGRCAHLTAPTDEQVNLGRMSCIKKNQCERGCSRAAYYSAESSSTKAARNTGNLTEMYDSVVLKLNFEPGRNKVVSITVIDKKSKNAQEISAKAFFLCASTIASTQILLNSKSTSFPQGLGNSSGVLGHYLMDHMTSLGAKGIVEIESNDIDFTRPTGSYIPRFNHKLKSLDYKGGYAFQCYVSRGSWSKAHLHPGIGSSLKKKIEESKWYFQMDALAEMQPHFDNTITLNENETDEYDLPLVKIDCKFKQNELRMKDDIKLKSVEILKKVGLKNVESYDSNNVPGQTIHEMGTARMGNNPKESVVNQFNKLHDVANVFVADGSCMVSSGCVNPSLTYMALAARAANYCSSLIKNNQL